MVDLVWNESCASKQASKQASKPDLYRLSRGFIDGSGKQAMKLSDEMVAVFARVIGNDAQAIAKGKGIPEARQTYGWLGAHERLRGAGSLFTPGSSRSRGTRRFVPKAESLDDEPGRYRGIEDRADR